MYNSEIFAKKIFCCEVLQKKKRKGDKIFKIKKKKLHGGLSLKQPAQFLEKDVLFMANFA